MALKPHGRTWTVLEQILEDPVSGLTYQFRADEDGICRLIVTGESLPFGNREFLFSAEGKEIGAGVAASPTRPSWLTRAV